MRRVRSSIRVRRWAAAGAAIAVLLAACGGDDDSGAENDTGTAATAETDAGGTAAAGGDDSDADPGGGDGDGNGGTLVLGDETIAFDSARCFLDEQDAAAGGGKILFVVQAFGTNAAGDELTIDVSRYDEDSQFVGDDIIVDIGDPFSDDAVSLKANADLGTVAVDGSTVSAGDLTFVNSDDAAEQMGSFEINC